jgi:glycosyltransferase involved in cell wall biosynthesis
MAPLVRHDRAHDHDQTVVTLWSLEAWTAPERLDRGDVAWQRAMLRRATRFADAVVVPTHAMAAELAEIAPLGARIRVIAGAPSPAFDQVADDPARTRALGLPRRYVVVLGRSVDCDGLVWAFRAIAGLDVDVVVVGDGDDDPARVLGLALAEGIPDHRVRAPHVPDSSDRASVLAGAAAVVSASTAPAFPWRALEALATGAPLVAARTAQNEELLAEGAHLAAADDSDELGEALRRAIEDDAFAARLRVLSADRARAFSWRDAAERVWQLHAEL